MWVCISIYLSIYRSIYLSICLSNYLSIYLSIYISRRWRLPGFVSSVRVWSICARTATPFCVRTARWRKSLPGLLAPFCALGAKYSNLCGCGCGCGCVNICILYMCVYVYTRAHTHTYTCGAYVRMLTYAICRCYVVWEKTRAPPEAHAPHAYVS